MDKYNYSCKFCGVTFKSYQKKPSYCSRKCKVSSQIVKIDFEKAKELYESGMTIIEVADKLNTTKKILYNHFKRNNYRCRPAIKRNQFRENNSSWKGDDVTYSAFHCRVKAVYGKPLKCEVCGTEDKNKTYDWACVGDYKSIKDYRRMCRSCHWKHDKTVDNFLKVKRESRFKHIRIKAKIK